MLNNALFVVLLADADMPGFEHAVPAVAPARFWIPSTSFGHTFGCGNVRESIVYAMLKFETNAD